LPIYYSDFNDPAELNDYYYDNDTYRGAQITNSYLEVYLGLYGKSTVYVMSAMARYKQAIPGSGVKIKARVSAYSNKTNMSDYACVMSGIIVFSATNTADTIRLGFSTPYLIAVCSDVGGSAVRYYSSGSWDGTDTGWHILEMDLYSDRIEFYFDGTLVYTLNNNPFANGQIYFGIVAGAGTGSGSSGYARADWLEVDPISTVVDTLAYPSLTAQQSFVYTPVDTTAYPTLSLPQEYTPPAPIYTPVDTLAYPTLSLQQEYTPPPTPTPVTPLPSVSQYYLLVFIMFFLMMLALSRRRR